MRTNGHTCKDRLTNSSPKNLLPWKNQKECGGLGIINTVMRLKLLYPQTLRFALENKKDGGVRVVMGASLKRDTNAKGGQQDVLRDGYRGQQADRP